MAWTMESDDSINGADGFATFTLDGKTYQAGNWEKITATTEVSSTDFKVLGSRTVKTKPGTAKGKVTVEGFVVDSLYKREYIKWMNGKRSFPVLTLHCSNVHDTRGTETVVLKQVKFMNIPIVSMDANADLLPLSMDGTFDGADMPKSFTDVIPKI